MRAEKENNIPVKYRTGFAISVESGKSANEMNEHEWEKFYQSLCAEFKSKYPKLYGYVFSDS